MHTFSYKLALLLAFLCPLSFGQAAYQLSPVAHQQFADINGKPLAGGFVYTYTAGSTTPLVTYKDNAGTANTNPIVLDAGGFATIYLSQNSYKFIVQNSATVQQWTQDNIQNVSQILLTTANVWTGTNTFQALINLSGSTSDTTAANGNIWYRTDLNRLRWYETGGAAWHSIVGVDTTDTLTNKTLTTPTLTSPAFAGIATGALASTSTVSATPVGIVAPAYLVAGVPTFLYVTADFSSPADTALHIINGLTFNTPVSQALVIPFVCDVMYSQATAAVADQFGIQDSPIAPTNIAAMGDVWISTSATTAGNLPTLTTTTATPFVTFTPSATATVFNAHWGGTIQVPSNATPSTVGFMVQTSTAADVITVKQGSMCRLF